MEKNIRIKVVDAEAADGWYVEDGTIVLEFSKSDWANVERRACNSNIDFVLAEHVLDLVR